MYSKPLKIKNKPSFMYHTNDLLGEKVEGRWDLTHCIDGYLSNVDFSGKRVIDIGAASGYLSFIMEQKGAEVVSYDMSDGSYWDHLILKDYEKPKPEKMEDVFESYWFFHERLNSKNKVFQHNLYELFPDDLGRFDVAVFGTILSHLRDPIMALMNVCRLVDKEVILINLFPESGTKFMEPSSFSWWNIGLGDIELIMSFLGFRLKKITNTNPKLVGKTEFYKSLLFERN
jgi:SAM-dependent methyltransferase